MPVFFAKDARTVLARKYKVINILSLQMKKCGLLDQKCDIMPVSCVYQHCPFRAAVISAGLSSCLNYSLGLTAKEPYEDPVGLPKVSHHLLEF